MVVSLNCVTWKQSRTAYQELGDGQMLVKVTRFQLEKRSVVDHDDYN